MIGSTAVTFVLGTSGLLFVQLLVFHRSKTVTGTGDESDGVTLATWITITRGCFIALLAGFLVVERPGGVLAWIPAIVFGGSLLLDIVDGRIARATDTVTRLGSRLDGEIDALTVLVGTSLAVLYGVVPTVYFVVGLANYVFNAGKWYRRIRGLSVEPLPDRFSRRILGGVQMCIIFLALLPLAHRALPIGHSLPTAVPIAAMVPFLLGYLRDWLLVTDRL